MKTLILVLLTAFAGSASADDCVNSIFKLHDVLTSKNAIQVAAAFSSVTLADQLGQNKLMKDYFDAYVSSDESKQSTADYQTALQASLAACGQKTVDCKDALLGFVNAVSAPLNRYAKALAVNTLVKQMANADLFVASQKNLDDEMNLFNTTVSKALQPATQACR